MLHENKRVSIHIAKPVAWVSDLVPLLNGKRGVIEKIQQAPSFNGYKISDPTYLVRFDNPIDAPGSWHHGTEAFWFDRLDLV